MLRRFDAAHDKPRMRSRRFTAAADSPPPLATDAAPVPPATEDPLDVETPLLDQFADRLMSTQAAQLADYLRMRQAELARQQRQLDAQRQSLAESRPGRTESTAAVASDAGSPPRPVAAPAAKAPAEDAPSGTVRSTAAASDDEAIRLLLETLEQQRLAYRTQLQAAHDATPLAPAATTSPAPAVPSRAAPAPAAAPTLSDVSRAAAPSPSDHGAARPKYVVSPPPPTDEPAEADSRESTSVAFQLLAAARRLQRETLEERLAIERLRLELDVACTDDRWRDELSRHEARIREASRKQRDELETRQDELREWSAECERRQNLLRKQRRELQVWVARRYEELEVIAARLASREQELDRQEQDLARARAGCAEEAAEYQRQIRQLAARLRCRDELGRVA